MSQNPEIKSRVNPLTEKLNAIARLNAEHGVRAAGGQGVPTVAEPAPAASGGARMLPPEPVPVSPEEEERLRAEFDRQWGGAQQPVQPVARPAASNAIPPGRVIPQDLVAIDLVNSQVIATSGETYPIEEAERKELRQFAFRVMLRALNAQVAEIARSLGITETVAEEGQKEEPTPKRRKK